MAAVNLVIADVVAIIGGTLAGLFTYCWLSRKERQPSLKHCATNRDDPQVIAVLDESDLAAPALRTWKRRTR